jgi:uncharacterized phosphosugar-binding protein
LIKQAFYTRLAQLIQTIESTQDSAVEEAAKAISDAIAAGGAVHIYDTGHMLDSELISRAGGLVAFKPLRVHFDVQDDVRSRPGDKDKVRCMEGLMGFALAKSNARPGDVLVVGSVSGKGVLPVDLAILAKETGLKVIALTSVSYSSLLQSEHSSGKRLFEAADICIDNCAPPLDAMIEVPELGLSICPASGLSAAALMWAVTAQVVDNLLHLGVRPTVYKSINFPGSAEFNEAERRRYAETGF